MNIITDVVLPIALAFIMFSLGLGLSINDFTRIFLKPKEFFIGFLSQLIILPIVALILVYIWPLSPEIAIGVMILAAAPGGATSNILTSFAKGDVALSISLTAVISILSVITIPLILGISLSILGTNLSNQGISLMDIALKMFLIVTIPVLIGMSLSKIFNSFESLAKKISTVLFFLVLLGAVLAERENVVSYFAEAGLITLILNVLMMFIAFYLSKTLISNVSQQRAITLECGLQNGTLAIVVANVFFDGGAYLIPAATYSLIMYATALPYIYFLRRN
jgi:BASS family bile acid:Na+ symporter